MGNNNLANMISNNERSESSSPETVSTATISSEKAAERKKKTTARQKISRVNRLIKQKKGNTSDMQDLVIANNPKSSFAEAIKSIKTNLVFSAIDTDVKVILITSPEPGDGKSFLVANLATAFAQDGKKVLVIDSDMRRGRQHEIFHVSNNATQGYSNCILKYKATNDAGMLSFIRSSSFVLDTEVPNVYLLPAGPTPPNPLELISSENNRRLIADFRNDYDVIIIDCPPALGLSDALVMSQYSDVNIIAVTSDKTKVDQLETVKKSFEKVNSKISGVVINRVKAKAKSYSSYYTNEYYTRLNDGE